MKSLIQSLGNFQSATHDVHEITVSDLVDQELLTELKVYNNEFEKLNESQLREMILIQSKILFQLGLYGDEEENPITMVVIVPKEDQEDQAAKVPKPAKK